MGIYNVSGTSSYKYDLIRGTADELTTEMIPYSTLSLCSHDATGTYIYPEDITKIRCDGVIEYCYEYNDVVVRDGTNGVYGYWWDISRVGENGFHSPALGPQQQAEDYLDFVY